MAWKVYLLSIACSDSVPWCPGYVTYKPAFPPQGIETHPEMRWHHRPVLYQRHSGAAAAAAAEIGCPRQGPAEIPACCLPKDRSQTLPLTLPF